MFEQINKLLTPVVDVTNQSHTLMFTRYTDGTILAYLGAGSVMSAANEYELKVVIDNYVEKKRESKAQLKQLRIKQLQDEIEKIKLENDFNDDV